MPTLCISGPLGPLPHSVGIESSRSKSASSDGPGKDGETPSLPELGGRTVGAHKVFHFG